ncbi:MAG: DUF4296 domain-containing protein [Rikenellaceae bacterium]
MKKIILSSLLLLSLILPSCIRRTVIPDTELALIFRDAFLTNAYIITEKVNFDTLQVYQPIFDEYGYTTEDIAYTIGSFSKRKSARLSDIVEQSIRLLEEGESIYRNETMILDTIDAKALRAASQTIYSKDLVTFRSERDTVNLKIEIDSLLPGDYILTFDYLVDSLDTNRSSYRSLSWITAKNSNEKKAIHTSHLRKHTESTLERKFKFDTLTPRLIILLAESFEAKRNRNITFRDIKVDYTPPVEEAVDLLFKNKLDVRIFADDFFSLYTTDSLELSSL